MFLLLLHRFRQFCLFYFDNIQKLSFHLLLGRPTFLLPWGWLSRTIFTNLSLSILDTWLSHPCRLAFTYSVIGCILHVSRMFSLRILAPLVFPIIFLSIAISATCIRCFIFAVSAVVSMAYVMMGLTAPLYIRAFVSNLKCLFIYLFMFISLMFDFFNFQ